MLSLKCQEFLPGTILIRRSLSFFEAIRDLGVRKVNLSDTEPVRSVRLTYWCDGRPMGFPSGGFPDPQGPYYWAVGSRFTAGREIVESHLDTCLSAGLNITGINAEVMLGQWEFQCFGKGAKRACDDLIVARYLLYRTSEGFRPLHADHLNVYGAFNEERLTGTHEMASYDGSDARSIHRQWSIG